MPLSPRTLATRRSCHAHLHCAVATLAFALAATVAVDADPLPGVATPEPIATEAPGVACRFPDFVTIDEAFAQPITDIVTLRFIAFVENLAPKDQTATLKRIQTVDLPQAHTEITAAEQIGCPEPQIGIRTARMLYAISARWQPTNTSDALVNDARWAIGALQIRDRIGRSILDEQLAKFGTDYATLAAPLATTACQSDADARIVRAVQPPYPSFAGANRIDGSILVKVSLDSEGLVTAASLFRREVPAGQGGDELARVSLAAAATSTYAPAIAHCVAIDGAYVFRAKFNVKR